VTVIDPSGSVVLKAQLQIRHLETNDTLRADYSSDRHYTFRDSSLGTYELTVTKGGFDTQISSLSSSRPAA